MKIIIVQQAIGNLQNILHQNADLQELCFFDGVFNVLATLELEGKLEDELFQFYLSDFIREGGVARVKLKKYYPDILAYLDKML